MSIGMNYLKLDLGRAYYFIISLVHPAKYLSYSGAV
jgi:hypothetical protein